MRRWKAAAIVNPRAGGGRARRIWRRERLRLQPRLGPIPDFETAAPGHAATLAAELRKRDFNLLLIVGGDGTLSDAANGLLACEPEACGVTLAPVPAGKGSDLARAVRPGDEPSRIDAIRVAYCDPGGSRQQRWCVNMASFGLGSEVARRRGSGYLAGAVAALCRARPVPVRLAVDGRAESFSAVHVAIGNGVSQGGGMRLCPRAALDDGQLEVTVIGKVGLLDLAANLRRIYSGRIYDHPQVTHLRGSHILAEADAGLEIDGDPIGRLPAEFTAVRKALRLVRL